MKQEIRQWLLSKHATPTEIKIFLYALTSVRGNNICFQLRDIAAHHGTTRQNLRQNLTRMIKKGLIKKNSFKTYVPAKTF